MDFEKDLERIADQYRAEGFVVIPHPDADHVPSFAAGFSPELLATRADENVLVTVKSYRTDLTAVPDLSRYADIINRQPGWRYDVVLLHQDSPMRRLVGLASEPSLEQTLEMLNEAERVLQVIPPRAAFVLAWAGLEAVMRRVAQRTGLDGDAGTQPTVLVRELYSAGRLSHEDFRRVEEMRLVRMSIVHGFAPVPVDAEMVQAVVGIARGLLGESESMPAAAG